MTIPTSRTSIPSMEFCFTGRDAQAWRCRSGIPNSNYCFDIPASKGGSACYSDPTQGPILRARNDQLATLWEASGALYPSIYLVANFSESSLRQYVTNGVREAVRCGQRVGGRRVYSYQWSYFHQSLDGKLADGVAPVPTPLQSLPFDASFEAGADGVIMWDCPGAFGHRTVQDTQALTMSVVGPAAQAVLQAAHNCSVSHCSGNGRCASLKQAARVAGAVECWCFSGWQGTDCSRHG
jgi:hypothetical protein